MIDTKTSAAACMHPPLLRRVGVLQPHDKFRIAIWRAFPAILPWKGASNGDSCVYCYQSFHASCQFNVTRRMIVGRVPGNQCPAKYRTAARAPSDPRKPFKAVLLMASPASFAHPPTERARKSDADSQRVKSNAGYREHIWHDFKPADI